MSEKSEVWARVILASGDVVIRVLMELNRRILDGIGMPEFRATSVAISVFDKKEI